MMQITPVIGGGQTAIEAHDMTPPAKAEAFMWG